MRMLVNKELDLKILLGIDPSQWCHGETPTARSTVHTINLLSKLQPCSLHPAFVASPNSKDSGGSYVEEIDTIQACLAESFDPKTITLHLPKALSKERGMDSDVALLAKHAEEIDADVILVTTHGRRGFDRVIFGSFAERLLPVAKVPVLIVSSSNSNSTSTSTYSQLLFPTDFSSRSFQVFENAVAIARTMGLKIEVIGKTNKGPVPPETIDHWIDEASKNQVHISCLTQTVEKESIPNFILQRANSIQDTIVVMGTHLNPDESLLSESYTIKVLENANCPVWVFHLPTKNSE